MSVLSCLYFSIVHVSLWVGCVCCEFYCVLPDSSWESCTCLESVRLCAFCHIMHAQSIEWTIRKLAWCASCLCYMFLLSLSAWVDPFCEWAVYALSVCLYVLVVTLGMSGPICEWAISASCVRYMLLLSLLAWVDPSVSWLYWPRVYIICSCCHSRHKWTHLWVGCIGLLFALYVLVLTLNMSGPICELAVSASRLHYMLLLSLSA